MRVAEALADSSSSTSPSAANMPHYSAPSYFGGATGYDCRVMLGYYSYNSMRRQSTRQTTPLFEKENDSNNLLDECIKT